LSQLPMQNSLSTANPRLAAISHQPDTSRHITPLNCCKSKSCYDWRSVGQSVLDQTFITTVLTVAGLLMWGALSDGRMGLLFARVTVSRTEKIACNNPSNFIMGSCLVIDWILFPLEYVYQPFLLTIVARQWYYTLQYLKGHLNYV
jgi:hypothetical protein